MTDNKLKEAVYAALKEYCLAEEVYGDNAWLQVDTKKGSADIISEEEAELSPYDCYEIMELLMPAPENPAQWMPDPEAVESIL